MNRLVSKWQEWCWNEERITVIDLRTGEEKNIKWAEIVNIRRRAILLEGGQGIRVIANEDENKKLQIALVEEWKAQFPCRWVDSARKAVKSLYFINLLLLPGMIVVFSILPWLGFYIFLSQIDADYPDYKVKCIRMTVLGVAILLGWFGYYFWKIRDFILDGVQNIKEVSKLNDCGET